MENQGESTILGRIGPKSSSVNYCIGRRIENKIGSRIGSRLSSLIDQRPDCKNMGRIRKELDTLFQRHHEYQRG